MNTRCANLACVCEVAMLGDACGESCKTTVGADPDEVRCRCGHPACSEEMQKELHQQ